MCTDAGLRRLNRVLASSRVPPQCAPVSREEGGAELRDGQILFAIQALAETNTFGTKIAPLWGWLSLRTDRWAASPKPTRTTRSARTLLRRGRRPCARRWPRRLWNGATGLRRRRRFPPRCHALRHPGGFGWGARRRHGGRRPGQRWLHQKIIPSLVLLF
ncbi:pyruvoyl-dependent arginine decarboxylase [Streptomyces lavendofoliae]|uniref:pyruvoyl-dependent arginine decarboxylase n=1 Tax=Streptomyces lavendofoliae TaxID=67314 RepID=UPI003D91B69D